MQSGLGATNPYPDPSCTYIRTRLSIHCCATGSHRIPDNPHTCRVKTHQRAFISTLYRDCDHDWTHDRRCVFWPQACVAVCIENKCFTLRCTLAACTAEVPTLIIAAQYQLSTLPLPSVCRVVLLNSYTHITRSSSYFVHISFHLECSALHPDCYPCCLAEAVVLKFAARFLG